MARQKQGSMDEALRAYRKVHVLYRAESRFSQHSLQAVEIWSAVDPEKYKAQLTQTHHDICLIHVSGPATCLWRMITCLQGSQMDEQELEKTISLVCKRVEQLKLEQQDKLQQLQQEVEGIQNGQMHDDSTSSIAEEQPS